MKTKALLATFVALLTSMPITSVHGQTGVWTSGAPMTPTRGSTQGAVINGKLYAPGGSNANGFNFGDVEIYDTATNSWVVKSGSTGQVRGEVSGGAIDGKVYVAGGWLNSDANSPSSAIQIYNPDTDSWSTASAQVIARGGSASAVVNGKLYITGGRGPVDGDIAALEIYDPVTDQVTSSNDASSGIPAIPRATEGAAGVELGGKFYVLGGDDDPHGAVGRVCSVDPAPCQTAIADMYIYDPATKTWSQGPSMPGPLWTHVAAALNGKIYVTGGQTSLESAIPNTNLWIYDPQQQSWSVGPSDPSGHLRAVVGVANSQLIVAGGLTLNSSGSTVDNPSTDIFTPGPDYTAQVQPPINSDGTSVFAANRGVVPVKFTLAKDGTPTCDLPAATISLTRTAGGTPGSVNESVYSTSADVGSAFRVDSCQYVYNLRSSALGAGTYRAEILINGQSVGNAGFQLK